MFRHAFSLLTLLAVAAPTFAPLAEGSGSVQLTAQGDGWAIVATPQYEVRLEWIPAGALPSGTPVRATVTLPDGNTLAYAEEVRVMVNSAARRNTEDALDQTTLPPSYLARLASATLEEGTDRVEVTLRFSFADAPNVQGNLSGLSRFTFLPTRVEHAYGYRFPSATAPSVRVNASFSFAQPYAEHLSIDPLGLVARDDGESLDGYSTWGADTAFGILFRSPARTPTAFDLHRLDASGYTNYLDDGRIRGYADHAWIETWMNAIDAWPPVFTRVGVEVVDVWNFPSADVVPRELARFYAELRGGVLGGLPPMPPLLDATPFPLRCPSFGPGCAPVVVAVIDSGVNPYHAWFRRPGYTAHPSTYLPGFPTDAPALGLTFSVNHSYNKLVDLEALGSIGRDQLVTIPGTNIVGAISFGEYEPSDSIPIVDEFGHGSQTAGAVVAANPDVLLVIVEMGFQDLERALAWVAQQEWIDLVTMSLGTLGDVGPLGRAVDAADASPQNYTRTIAQSGRMVFVPTGNNAGYGATDFYDGPNWIVSVGGVNRDTRGWWAEGTHGQDVSSDARRALPRPDHTSDVVEVYGTSFASPTLAGSVSGALQEARAALGQTSVVQDGVYLANGARARDIRDAINATAHWYSPTDYRPPNRANLTTPAKQDDLPFPPVAPWTVSGWGYLGPAQAPLLRDVLLGVAPAPEKPAEAHAFMEAQYAARAAIWTDTYPLWGPHVERPIVER